MSHKPPAFGSSRKFLPFSSGQVRGLIIRRLFPLFLIIPVLRDAKNFAFASQHSVFFKKHYRFLLVFVCLFVFFCFFLRKPQHTKFLPKEVRAIILFTEKNG